MSKSCRFTIAVHCAALLALAEGQPLTSDWIAGSVNTNPVVVRRVLSALAKAGLVHTARGSTGGSLLSRPGAAITLLDLERAVGQEDTPSLHRQPPNPNCPVGKSIQPVLTQVFKQAETARHAVLAKITVADIVAAIQAQAA
jgi:Rrf2 family protein